MKIDLYTKIVLTIIAISLVTISLKDVNLITTAQAATAPIPAPAPQATNAVMDVNIVQVRGYTVGAYGVPVKVENEPTVSVK